MCIKIYRLLGKKLYTNKKSQYKKITDENSFTKKEKIIFDFDLTLEDRIEIGKATLKEMFKEIA